MFFLKSLGKMSFILKNINLGNNLVLLYFVIYKFYNKMVIYDNRKLQI